MPGDGPIRYRLLEEAPEVLTVPLSEPAAVDDRSLGWLRYLHRKATTPDDWSRTGRPHPHWDDRTGSPMLSWHRFDLVDSSYAVALMADRTPAWREVYAPVLDALVARHTSWWSASDWLTQFGPDPDRNRYPEAWRPLVPRDLWGDYDVPGWTANGIEPYGVQMDPVAADGMLFFKGFLTLLMGLHRYVSGDEKWDDPFEMAVSYTHLRAHDTKRNLVLRVRH